MGTLKRIQHLIRKNEGHEVKQQILGLFNSIKIMIDNLLRGRVHLPKKYIEKILLMDDQQEYTIFRHVKVDSKKESNTSKAVFKVRFKFAGLSSGINKYLSLIPVPFLIGLPGFREKYWTINEETGFFQGIYQWESKEFAEKYPQSFIFKVMTKRSAPNSLTYEIIPNTDLSNYVEKFTK